MEWIDGIKLTDARRISEASLNKKQLIDQGLYCSLKQLLEEGFFHADPHPGNLVATDDGSLAYFDFGMMGDIPRHYRVGLIRMLVHYVNRDSSGLANDFLSLGFIPDGTDIQLVADAVHASFGDGSRQSNDFQIAAISEQSSESANETPLTWKTFDMRSVVAATEDLFCFILSEKGWWVRVFLIQDIVKAANAFLEEEALPCIFNKQEAKERFDTESDALVMRLINGFRSLQQAISLAPEVWTAMFLRTLVKSDTHRFLLDIFLSLAVYSRNKMPEAFFRCISRLLHLLEKGYDFQEDT
ncbi:ABC1 family [Musa troglodytarum]|uniref:ABC1 family n=1 Tax=Musa troglodytarum TaxID=320322 RepID=A0A9E7EDJ0_9LILI|nr:ABC1 family [Musa troglodytarum]